MKNRKRLLNKYIGYTVTVKFLDGESYTGTLVAKQDEKYAYYVLYEEDGMPRSKYFQWQDIVELWVYYQRGYKIMYKREGFKK